MGFDFPDAPVVGQRYQSGANWWVWNSFAWEQFGIRALTALSPGAMTSYDPPAQLTVYGSMFGPESRIIFGGAAQTTTCIGPTELRATVNPNRQPGNVPVTVAIGQATPAPLNFVISAQAVPTLTAMTPTRGMQGGSYPVQLTGTQFRADSEVKIDDVAIPFTFISAARIDATIVAPPKGNARLSSLVKVVNDGAASNSLTFTYDAVTATRVATNPVVTKMNEPMTITVNGTNFGATEQITAGGVALTTTLVSSTELTASYTSPYFETTVRPPPPYACPVNVTGSVSPNLLVSLVDPRAYIRSTYPDIWTEWASYINDIEVWCWGPIGDGQNGLPMSIVHVDGAAVPTKFLFNFSGTESILEMNIQPSGDDRYVQLTVVNDGKHTGPNFGFWYEFIG